MAIFCGFMQTLVSLGSAIVLSQDEWSWKMYIATGVNIATVAIALSSSKLEKNILPIPS